MIDFISARYFDKATGKAKPSPKEPKLYEFFNLTYFESTIFEEGFDMVDNMLHDSSRPNLFHWSLDKTTKKLKHPDLTRPGLTPQQQIQHLARLY